MVGTIRRPEFDPQIHGSEGDKDIQRVQTKKSEDLRWIIKKLLKEKNKLVDQNKLMLGFPMTRVVFVHLK